MSDREAIGTLSFFAVTMAICAGSCIALARRAKPAVRAIAGHSRSELMLGSPDDSGTASTSHLVTNWSAIYGHRRIALLFLSNVLLIGECLNSLVYYAVLWLAPHLTNTPINYLLDGITIIPAGTIICLATTYRIALILVTHPVARQKLLKAATALALVIPLTLFVKIAVGVVQYWHITVDEWQRTTIVQPEIAILIALYPTLTISGSVWSIKVVLTRQSTAPVACTASKWEPNAISRTAALAPDESVSSLSAVMSSSTGRATSASASAPAGASPSHPVTSAAPAPVVLADSLKTTFTLLVRVPTSTSPQP
ncbi:hypothetical protein BCR44DRAFT_64894 [Catenaria anguillulae PL171]|uniref:Uncharacterized protein n=1 Tax=Catenaria anguillulae PL171 TaxID=765915 RepID=A0A1Y2HBH8_9FUNG|nr:hypothetical protein BCR44DRAFT_64894 [Catenaria anguillulae PL171]